MRDLPLHLVVLENLLMGEVHQEDLAGTESSLLLDAFRFDIEYPDLRAHHHQAVRGDGVASRPQAVAVERSAHEMAVEEGHRRRTVPRLHQAGVVMIESLHVGGNFDRAFPGLGDHH